MSHDEQISELEAALTNGDAAQSAAVQAQADADAAAISKLKADNMALTQRAAQLRAELVSAERSVKDAVAQDEAEREYYSKRTEELEQNMSAKIKMLELQADVAEGKPIEVTPGDGFSERLLQIERELLSSMTDD